METQLSEIGMIGLGVMGRNLLLNMADHGFAVGMRSLIQFHWRSVRSVG